MQALYIKNLILIVNFSKSGQIRANPDKIGEEIPRRKMHDLKIVETLEPQGFEGCERGKIHKLSSYYIHHFNSTKAKKKSGYIIPTDEKKRVGIIYPQEEPPRGYNIPTPKTKKSGYNIPT